MTDEILVGREGEIGIVTLNRPHALNAWTMRMRDELCTVLASLGGDDGVRAVVLTGAGDRAFCAGQDLAETAAFGPDEVDGWLENFRTLYETVLGVPKPVVAALDGVAAGSGYQFALLCDVRVGYPGLRMGQPEVSSGIPSITGMYLTERAVGSSRMIELMLSGRLMEIDELRQTGIVHHVVAQDQVLAKAVDVARQLARQPSVAVALTKEEYRRRILPGLRDAFESARDIDERAWASGQPQQVMQDFFESRRAAKAAEGTAGA